MLGYFIYAPEENSNHILAFLVFIPPHYLLSYIDRKKKEKKRQLENRAMILQWQKTLSGKKPSPHLSSELILKSYSTSIFSRLELTKSYSQSMLYLPVSRTHSVPFATHIKVSLLEPYSKGTFKWSKAFHFRSEFSIFIFPYIFGKSSIYNVLSMQSQHCRNVV